MPKHILAAQDFANVELLEDFFRRADKMEELARRKQLPQILQGKTVAIIFTEPSTRTSISFETAAQRLGAYVIVRDSARYMSSISKGESSKDTRRVLECYDIDCLIMRHHERGGVAKAAEGSSIPVISGGDGDGEHPTQMLTDIYTMRKERGSLYNLSITLFGDLKFSRTVHSLVEVAHLFRWQLNLVSPRVQALTPEYREKLLEQNITFTETADLNSVLPHTDILYVTRVQEERFSSREEYEAIRGSCVVCEETLVLLPQRARILHPLPRREELPEYVDDDPRAAYWRQVRNGLFMRMGLFEWVFA